ncbi:hypothetical protein [Autumnicola patrickiae]|uniref:hypothetical protein n=1 Tax=Autumnicola patrickiae TaxID=3075591 RepID=UPI003D786F43
MKYENIYLNPPESGVGLYRQLSEYFDFYNHRRRHQGIKNEIPFNRYLKQEKLHNK